MALFLSTYTNKVDAKGRVSVPAQFRASLISSLGPNTFQGIVLIPSTKLPVLEGFSMEMMQELSRRFDTFDLARSADDLDSLAFFGDATPLGFDETGRIGLPKELLAHAKIADTAIFVGLGTKFQIWEPEAFAARRDKAIQNLHSKGQG